MSREKQIIEDMTKTIDRAKYDMWVGKAHQSGDFTNHSKNIATALYNADYRKQSKGEWIEHIRVSKEGKPLLRHYQCNLCGVYLARQANFCPNCGAKMKGGAG